MGTTSEFKKGKKKSVPECLRCPLRIILERFIRCSFALTVKESTS